jgi:hypothetical protein
MDHRGIEVRSPAEAKDSSCSLCVQTGSEAHPASCTMGTGGPSPGLKRGRGVTLTTHPHLVPRSRMSRSYISSPPRPFMACSGTALALFCKRTWCSYAQWDRTSERLLKPKSRTSVPSTGAAKWSTCFHCCVVCETHFIIRYWVQTIWYACLPGFGTWGSHTWKDSRMECFYFCRPLTWGGCWGFRSDRRVPWCRKSSAVLLNAKCRIVLITTESHVMY